MEKYELIKITDSSKVKLDLFPSFPKVLWQHQGLIRARLSDDSPAVLLAALARGAPSPARQCLARC